MCPDEQQLAAWADAERSVRNPAIEAHLASCEDCRLIVDLIRADRRSPESAAALRPGDRLGHFELREGLGAGGMGHVFAATDTALGRSVAIKVLTSSTRAKDAVLTEARTLASLSHPNVATIFAVGESDGVPYLAMELLEGGTLLDWLRKRRPSAREVLRVFAQLAAGLAHAHANGVLHCDFKPENVLFTSEGVPRIADFGLSISRDGGSPTVGGTVAYLAPERRTGQPPSEATDQFAFGVSLRQALEAIGRPRVALAVVSRLTAARPDARYPSLAEVVSVLEREASRSPLLRALATVTLVAALLSLAPSLKAWVERQRCTRAVASRLATFHQPLAVLSQHDATRSLHRHLSERLDGWRGTEIARCMGGAPEASAGQGACLAGALERLRAAVEHPGPERPNERLRLALAVPPAVACVTASEPRDVLELDPSPELTGNIQLDCPRNVVERLTTAVGAAKSVQWPWAEGSAWLALAKCHRARGEVREMELALELTGKAVSALPQPSLERDVLGAKHAGLLTVTGHGDRAAELLASLSAPAPERSGWLTALLLAREAHLAASLGQHARAEALSLEAVPVLRAALPPRAPELRWAETNLADTYLQTFHYEAARQLLESVEAEEPALALAESEVGLGEGARALPVLRAAIEAIEPGNWRQLALRGDQLFTWALAELEFGEPRRVETFLAAFREAEAHRDDRPLNVNVRRALEAEAVLRRGDVAKAVALLDDGARLGNCDIVRAVRCRQLVAAARVRTLAAQRRWSEALEVLATIPMDSNVGLDPRLRVRAALDVFESPGFCASGLHAARTAGAVDALVGTLGERAAAERRRVDELRERCRSLRPAARQ